MKEKLKRGETVFGQLILELFTPGVAYMLANCGLDFVLFDMEHGRCDLALVADLINSARGAGIVPLVRVPDAGFCPLSRALDLGALGLMVPRVETGEQMRDIVSQLKYAPAGRRGVALGVAHDRYRPEGPSFFGTANERTVVIALLETVRAFENLDDILSTPGLDVAWMGHYDLTVSMGIPAQFDHPRFLAAMDQLLASCQRHGIAPGFLPSGPAECVHWIGKGFRIISLGTDISVYQGALRTFHDSINASLVASAS
jgi:2-dehydro-3-deoxyglucarate aldolase/4-hydroxy-2-oxoheptanedioate aldolase